MFKENQLSIFQFHHLLRGKVPFALVHTGLNFEKIFSGAELRHIETYQLIVEKEATPETIAELLARKKVPKQYPVLLVCEDGVWSEKMTTQLQSGYQNCFFLEGGWRQLEKEPTPEPLF